MLGLIVSLCFLFQDAKLPDSPAGKIVRAYFTAFNSGDAAACQKFEEENRAAASLAKRPMSERLAQYREMRQNWGVLTPREVAGEKDNVLSVVVHAAASGNLFRFEFVFEKEPPKKLEAIRIEGPLDAADVSVSQKPLTAAETERTINDLIAALETGYVFPDKVAPMAELLRSSLKSGKYAAIDSAVDLARRLTEDVQSVCKDKHLRIRVSGQAQAASHEVPIPRTAPREEYGFEKTEVLPGNIGYIKINGLSPLPEAQKVAAEAMAKVADCGALVFDLRDNGGGSPVMIRTLQSYLFAERTHLNSFFDRSGKKVEDSWTSETVSGKRIAPGAPIYVLISSQTFSGAEEFAYNLQCRKRATIVGETSGGGAHPVRGESLGDRFMVTVPYMRAENPISKTNWEGTGVKPDISAPREKALERALEDAKQRMR